MSYTHSYTESYIDARGILTKTRTQSGDGEDLRQLIIPDSTTDQIVTFACTLAKILSLAFISDQNLLIEFNSNAGSGGHINLLANQPWIWMSGGYWTLAQVTGNVPSTDITAIYVTNTSGSAANLEIRLLQDSTI
jgi:hypothetical protein